jgi:hypothetical protein
VGFHNALGFNSNMGFARHIIVHTIILLLEITSKQARNERVKVHEMEQLFN